MDDLINQLTIPPHNEGIFEKRDRLRELEPDAERLRHDGATAIFLFAIPIARITPKGWRLMNGRYVRREIGRAHV